MNARISDLVTSTLYSQDSYLLLTAFESANEVNMKNYLLKPHKRLEMCKGEVWLVKANGLRDCWRFIKDKYFVCIHFIMDAEKVVRNINQEELRGKESIAKYIQEADVCLGILTKRGNASIKSMVKVYGCEQPYLS